MMKTFLSDSLNHIHNTQTELDGFRNLSFDTQTEISGLYHHHHG